MGQTKPVPGASDLRKSGVGDKYTHVPSKTVFAIPKGWKVAGKSTEFGRTALALRDAKGKMEVTASWAPMESNLKLKDYEDLERMRLGNKHGNKDVGEPATFKVGDRVGYRISLDYGPGLLGAAYVFEAGPDAGKKAGNRWPVKLFTLVPRETAKEDFPTVEAMMRKVKW
jgi:hypothetical protein